MYAFIKGKVFSKNPTLAVLESGGIGYEIRIALGTFERLEVGADTMLFTDLVVREDSTTLYGFDTENDKTLFRILIGVSGIGPNTAMLMLSSMSATEICTAIAEENLTLIQSIKGIGKKTAQRLVLELKDKVLKEIDFDTPPEVISHTDQSRMNKQEAVQALIVLGYKKADAEKVVNAVIKSEGPEVGVQEIIKSALKKK